MRLSLYAKVLFNGPDCDTFVKSAGAIQQA